MIGGRIGPYEITAKLGEGGMGEVYRATDTKLDRQVAIKVLPAAFTADPERLSRFEREAKLLAQLHHPQIASIFGLEESDGVRALVMELVDGPTLSERLGQGGLALDESLAIARQIAEALEAAHEKGIVHRDLKPQNIKITPEGAVKVLDFGLAKAMDPAAGSGSAAEMAQSPTLMNSPTLTAAGTALGMILGTAAYMAPEQAAGKTVDRRADIWAFGVVLWEMLTHRRLFEAETVPEILGAVFRQEIDLAVLPPETPDSIRRLVARCLERDPKLRLRDIGEARIALTAPERGTAGSAVPTAQIAPPAAGDSGIRKALPWMALALVLALAGMLIPRLLPDARPNGGDAGKPALTAFGIELPDGLVLAADEAPVLDLSRDGRTLVFEADGPSGRALYRRDFDRVGIERIAGTEGAVLPFFSPDGRSVGFFVGGKLSKIPVGGGVRVDVANASAYRGATWAEGGWIVFTATYSSSLLKVREGGGAPEPLTELDAEKGERTHRWPSAVAGTPWVLFSVGISKNPSFYDDARIDAVNLDTGERKTVYEGAWMARFAPPSTLLIQRRSTLLALSFEASSATVRGSEKVIFEGVGGESSSGAGYFAAGGGAAGGTLALVPADALSNDKALVAVDRSGSETVLNLPAKNYWYPNISPDGRKLAVDIGSGQGTDDDIWLYDFASEHFSRFTFQPASILPVWSADGRWIHYGGAGSGRDAAIYRKRADGVGAEERVWTGTDVVLPTDSSPDGRSIAVTNSTGQIDSYLVSNDGGEARELVAATGTQWGVSFSPDGRYIAYTTTETGLDEIFVSSFPEGAGKWQVSVDGGQGPLFSRDGRELYFVKNDALWAVDVDTRDGFRNGAPREILRGPYILRTAPARNYTVTGDGRFIFVRWRTDRRALRQLEVRLGWEALLAAAERR